jgi:membrane associated rhomboid family serine protease
MFILPTASESDLPGKTPWVTLSLIIANLVCFTAQVIVGNPLTYGYSLTPAKVTTDWDEPSSPLGKARVPVDGSARQESYKGSAAIPNYPGPVPIHLTFLTSMFLHAGLLHLLGNLWFLWIFGSLVERTLPSPLFLVVYLACGLGAAVTHVALQPHSPIPLVGASGAISGIMGAYLWLKPMRKLRVWIFFVSVDIPALITLPAWLLLQVLSGLATLNSGQLQGGVAYWAHVGGFATGLISLLCLFVWLKATDRPEPPAAVKEREEVVLSTAKFFTRPDQ